MEDIILLCYLLWGSLDLRIYFCWAQGSPSWCCCRTWFIEGVRSESLAKADLVLGHGFELSRQVYFFFAFQKEGSKIVIFDANWDIDILLDRAIYLYDADGDNLRDPVGDLLQEIGQSFLTTVVDIPEIEVHSEVRLILLLVRFDVVLNRQTDLTTLCMRWGDNNL